MEGKSVLMKSHRDFTFILVGDQIATFLINRCSCGLCLKGMKEFFGVVLYGGSTCDSVIHCCRRALSPGNCGGIDVLCRPAREKQRRYRLVTSPDMK